MSFLLSPHVVENAAIHMRCFGNQQWLQRSPLSPESLQQQRDLQQQQRDIQRAQREAWAARTNPTSDTPTDRSNNDCRDKQSHPETHSNNDSGSRTGNPESDNDKDSDSTPADSTNIETAAATNTANTGTTATNDDNKTNSNRLTKTAPALRDIDQYAVGRNHNRVQQEDVLCSNGGGSDMHPGNRLFMSIAAMHVNRYDPKALLSRPELRARVSVGIIREIPGRLLGKTHHNTLKPLGPRLAVRWVSFVVKTAAQRKVSQEQDE